MLFKKEHELLQKAIRDFVNTELDTLPAEMDKTGEMPRELLYKLAKYKYSSTVVPKEYGGAGADYLSYAIVMEEISRKCCSTGTYVTAGSSLVALPILNFGIEKQKQKYLKPLALGEMVGCFGLTEPGAGSDAGAQQTEAILEGDYYILNGRKCFITNAPFCDFAIVIAMTDKSKGLKGTSAFIVESKWEGFSHGAHEDKMGIRGTQTSDLVFENVRVPKENLIGKEGMGFKIAMNTLEAGRIGVAAQAVGVAQSALDEAIKYSKERVQFGKTLSKFQNTKFTLADMETKVNAARLLVYDSALKKDAGKKIDHEGSMAKYYAAEIANEVAYKALQIHGGYGYIKDYPIERIYRDARILSIYEGTSQVQQMVIAAGILK
ncbi:putative isocaproyl-CoA dehydrogenase AcdB [Crassaminicella profunda]|uniref:putative isocaproyl-CoA dehydrogenase AcdB n=1 Tax=Crassaminicella profunda TaxID=1286698 RepID=UPI001CA74D2D|nr:putative isocaproyl-CoA dehydrogenase AcdB [Crassaminicella profunda]QZY54077.1 acyl-CoA dehydrogenase family protein [Crassaminicella profunda]